MFHVFLGHQSDCASNVVCIQDSSERTGRSQAEIATIVAQWGENFREAAANNRFTFGSDHITIRLHKPFRIDGAETSTLTMMEPSLDDLEKLDGVRGQIAQTRLLIMSACRLTKREVSKIGLRDMVLIGILTSAFTEAHTVQPQMPGAVLHFDKEDVLRTAMMTVARTRIEEVIVQLREFDGSVLPNGAPCLTVEYEALPMDGEPETATAIRQSA